MIEKWGIKSSELLHIVRNRFIKSCIKIDNRIIKENETEQEIEGSLAFYTEEDETDEDAVLHFLFKAIDIREFEGKIARGELLGFVLSKGNI